MSNGCGVLSSMEKHFRICTCFAVFGLRREMLLSLFWQSFNVVCDKDSIRGAKKVLGVVVLIFYLFDDFGCSETYSVVCMQISIDFFQLRTCTEVHFPVLVDALMSYVI